MSVWVTALLYKKHTTVISRLATSLMAMGVTLALSVISVPLRAEDSTPTLRILSAQLDTRSRLHLALENQGTANIAAFAISCPGQRLIQEFLPPSNGIPAGGDYDFILELDDTASANGPNVGDYRILAVLHSDGTTEGSGQDLTDIDALRAGRAYRLTQVLPFLQSIKDSDDLDLPKKLDEVINTISTMELSFRDGSRATGLFANGLQNTNTLTLIELRKAKALALSDTGAVRQRIARLIGNHQAVLAASTKIISK